MVLVSYAAMTKTPISPSDLPALKGKWEGWRTPATGGAGLRTDLEILNDTLPLKVKITYHDVKRKGMMSGDLVEEYKATINKDGNFYFKSGQNYIELSLYKDDGKMKLDGDLYLMGFRGKMTINKK